MDSDGDETLDEDEDDDDDVDTTPSIEINSMRSSSPDSGGGEEGASAPQVKAGTDVEAKENIFDSLTSFANEISMSAGLFTPDFTFRVMTFVVPVAPFCPAVAAFDAATQVIGAALALGIALAFGVEATTIFDATIVAAFRAVAIFFLLAAFIHFPVDLTQASTFLFFAAYVLASVPSHGQGP
jgi:hypothetical protein